VAADRRRRGWTAIVGITLTVLAGCTQPNGLGPNDLSTTQSATAALDPNAATLRLVEDAVSSFNSTAGGPVATQQAALHRIVSAGQTAVQDKCPRASTTISFEPVYPRLSPSPDWRPPSGTLPGVVYALPTLIRIYTGDRITGTDLTDLHLSIQAGRVSFPALCVH
jgi:hypothetical protein